MEKFLMKNPFVLFSIPVIVCTFLGYLSHNLMNGILTGIFIGTGFVIGMELFERKQEKDERKGRKKK